MPGSQLATGSVDTPSMTGRAPPDREGGLTILKGWFALFLAAFALYAATASRGAQWQDSGHHILRIVTGESVNPLGLALSHPLHHWLGRLVAVPDTLEPCLAITLISSFAAALAVANTFGCVCVLTRRRDAALLAAASLALANTFWQMATVAETYTPAAALLSAEIWCLAEYGRSRRAKPLWLMALFNGLGIANHMLAALTTPVVVCVVFHGVFRKSIRTTGALIAAGLWLAGSAPYTGMIVAELLRGGDLIATLHSALFGHGFADEVLNTALSARRILVSVGFVGLNFPNLLVPVAVYGLTCTGRVGVPMLTRRALTAAAVIHTCFVIRYGVVDSQMFFLPLYVLMCVFGGIGFAAVQRGTGHPSGRRRKILLPTAAALLALTPLVYAATPSVTAGLNVLRGVARNKPYRNDYVYLFVPWSVVERSAERMSSEAVALAGDRGLVLVEDCMAIFAVQYKALRGGLADVDIVTDIDMERIIAAAAGGRPVVLVPLNADAPRTDPPIGSWKRVGDLYVLTTP